MIKQEMFYIVKETAKNFMVSPHTKILPILWCQNGEYRVFSKEILADAVAYNDMRFNHYSDKTIIDPANIWWDQGIPIDNLAGRALAGE